MKRLFLLVTVLCLALAPLAGAEIIQLSEPIPGLDMTIVLPDEAVGDLQSQQEWHWLRFTHEGPTYDLTIAPSDLFEGKNLSELSHEECQRLADAMANDADQPKVSFLTLENGLYAILLEEETERNDFAVLETLVNGYFIGLHVRYESYEKLSAADLENMLAIMGSIEITAAE